MKSGHAGWVLLNYPVVTSRSRDNAGGFDHLLGNLQVYRQLGFKVLCICRWSPRLIDRLDGAVVLNIVPGAAVPVPPAEGSIYAAAPDRRCTPRSPGWRMAARAVRNGLLALVGTGLQCVLRPRLLHQRANLRFMVSPRDRNALHLIELNDEFVPAERCDAYLTVVPRPALDGSQFAWRWPVSVVAPFDSRRFLQRLSTLANPTRRLKVLLFGIGGTTAPRDIHEFIQRHPWFQNRDFDLHVYGGDSRAAPVAGVIQHGWSDARALPANEFDAALLYYDASVYDDERLRLGSPTKLWKYIDWSLPVFCNREQVSKQFLGQFDCTDQVLYHEALARQFAEHLQSLRCQTLPDTYARELAAFLKGLTGKGQLPSSSSCATQRMPAGSQS